MTLFQWSLLEPGKFWIQYLAAIGDIALYDTSALASLVAAWLSHTNGHKASFQNIPTIHLPTTPLSSHLLPLTLLLQESRSQRPSPAFPHIGQHNLQLNNKVSKPSSLIRTIQQHQDTLIFVWNTKEIIRLQYNGLFSFPQVCFVSQGTALVRTVSVVDIM